MMRGMNMQQMMKQAKKMQQKMMEEQQNLAKEEFIGVSPDEMVKATFTGEKRSALLQYLWLYYRRRSLSNLPR